MKPIKLGLDARTTDSSGFLHIPNCVFTEEGVEEYLGSEIPECGEFGLDPARAYRVYRPLSVLEACVDTFNNKPVLKAHIPVLSELPNKDSWYGVTGEQSYIRKTEGRPAQLCGNMVIYLQEAIDKINTGELKSISCGYFRKHRKESGVWNGKPYELVIESMEGNHVAFVPLPRIANAMIGDSKFNKELQSMKNTIRRILGFDNKPETKEPAQDHDLEVLQKRHLELLENVENLDEAGLKELKETGAVIAALLVSLKGDEEPEAVRKMHEGAGLREYDRKNGGNVQETKAEARYDQGTGFRTYFGKDDEAKEADETKERNTRAGSDDFEKLAEQLIAAILPKLEEKLIRKADEAEEALEDASLIMGDVDKTQMGKDSDSIYTNILKAVGMDSKTFKTTAEKRAAVKTMIQTKQQKHMSKTSPVLAADSKSPLMNDDTFKIMANIKGV